MWSFMFKECDHLFIEVGLDKGTRFSNDNHLVACDGIPMSTLMIQMD